MTLDKKASGMDNARLSQKASEPIDMGIDSKLDGTLQSDEFPLIG